MRKMLRFVIFAAFASVRRLAYVLLPYFGCGILKRGEGKLNFLQLISAVNFGTWLLY